MSSNLGSMVLELSANVARFQSDMGKMYQSASDTAEKITSAFERVGAILGVGLGVDAFKEFVGGAIEAQDQALKFAQKVGISTESVAGLSSAAKKAGVDQQELQQALTKLSVSASEAANGVRKYSEGYAALGINVRDANGNVKAADVLFGELADKFASYKDGTTKTADAVVLLGKAGANLIPLLNSGSAAIQHQIELAKQLGAAIGTEAAKGAEEFKDKLIDLQLVTKGVGNQIASGLLPALNTLADKATKFFTSDTWKAWLADISAAATAVANNLGTIIATVKLLGEIAADYIGIRLVGSLITATANVVKLMVATLAANSAAASMGISYNTGVLASIKSIGLLNAALGSVFAAVSGWQIGTYLYNQFAVVRQIANNFIATFDALWTVISAGAQGAWLYIEKSFYTMLDAITGHLSDSLANMAGSFAKLPDAIGGSKLSAQFLALSAAIAPSGKAVTDLDTKIAALQQNTSKSLKIIQTSWDTGATSGKAFAGAIDSTGDAANKAAPNIAGLSDHADKAAQQLVEAATALDALQKLVTTIGGESGSKSDAAQAKFTNQLLALKDAAEAAAIAGNNVDDVIKLWQQGEDAAAKTFAKTTAEIAKQGDVLGTYLTKSKNDAALAALAPRAQAVAKAVNDITEAYKKEQDAGGKMAQSLKEVQDGAAAAAGGLYDAQEAATELNSIISEFGKNDNLSSLVDKLHKVQQEMKRVSDASSDAFDPARAKKLEIAIGNIRQAMVDGIVHSSQEGLRSLQSMTTQGSQAFKALQIAIDALTVVQAISAVLNQAQGDPYTAFARMAAMAAAVVALGVDIAHFGGSGGPSSASAEVRQQTQGTGTVLGDAKAQSDSIAKATAITADATTQLVGLNRGMLNALQALQQALGAAGVQLARGAGDATFPSVAGADNAFNNFLSSNDPLGGDPITKALGSFLFGGSKKVIDQGIVIFGGALNDMLTNIAVGAYQTIHTSGGIFSSGSTKDQTQAVSDEFTKQFQLVIKSIVDTVEQGALALGISQSQIDAAIAAYHVAEQHISLQGLSADDQQKALEAVFSSIFDGLAGAVVPFIAQFQKVGEGLGETLVRVATEVQVTQEAMKELGLAIATTDPEKFAQIADGLIQAAGGVDAFIQGMNDFVSKFAPDSAKFAFEQDSLTSALSQVGLTLPTTREGFYDLMKSLDATTAQGQQQIATLLRLADVADAYYTALEKVGDAQGDAIKKIQDSLKSLVDSTTQLAAQLFGTGADQIQARINDLLDFGKRTGLYDFVQIRDLTQQLNDQKAAQAHAQQVAQATSLISNFGQLGFMTGETLDQLAAQFNVPLDKLEKIFGTDRAGLDKQFAQAEAMAQATLGTEQNTAYANELLANLIAVQKGLPEPYSAADLASASTPVSATFAGGHTPSTSPGVAPPGRPGGTPLPVDPSVGTTSSEHASSFVHVINKLSTKVDTLSAKIEKSGNQNEAATTENARQISNLSNQMERFGFGSTVKGYRNQGGMPIRSYAP